MSKIAILLPDGVGLRNFIYSSFISELEKEGNEVFVWNGTVFPISELGFKEIPLSGRINPITDLIKQARKVFEIRRSFELTNDEVYLKYQHRPPVFKSIKHLIKAVGIYYYYLLGYGKPDSGFFAVAMEKQERKTGYYEQCKKQLIDYGIEKVFCTNQRHTRAVAPIIAAKDLGIRTSTFIFSWDNLPKATMVINTDNYCVWSEYMKRELQFYYPYIKDNQITITGTPQFTPHFDSELILDRATFLSEIGADTGKKYICFTGDDITTSPNDALYLRDVAKAVKEFNRVSADQYAILFRRCPVDFSHRYDDVLTEYSEIIYCANPKWENRGNGWDSAMPTREDTARLVNTIHHSELTINVGSSIVFDAACHDKPTCYINYNVEGGNQSWNVEQIYRFIHFKSMPTKQSVYWLNSSDDLVSVLKNFENTKNTVLCDAQIWFDVVCNESKDAIRSIVTTIEKM